MKVLAISGSPRPQGNTYHLLQEALQVLAREGLETEYLSLHDKDVRPCLACLKCAKDKNRCAQEDDFMPVFTAMGRADGLIVGSPVYFGSATPNLMALLDRAGYVARMGDNVFARKAGTPIVVARRAGVNFTYAQLLFFFIIMGMVVPGSTYWPIAYGKDPGEVVKDEEGMKTVATLAENLAWLMKKLAG
ncbi:MAG: flavodoxin family protein [Deltaproteobacteria bacterium]|nr:flavodoxin family protein [Deltaproteobacteria bacterium]